MSKQRSVLVVGHFSDRPELYTYATSFAHEFERCGLTVMRFDTVVKRNSLAVVMQRVNPRFKVLQDYAMNKQLVMFVEAHKPDLIFLLKAENVWSSTLKKLKKNSTAQLVNFYPDNPFACWNYNSNGEVLRSLPVYDCFLSWSKMLMMPLLSAGCKRVDYFPFGFEKSLFPDRVEITPEEQERYRSDACFIGTWDGDRAAALEQLIVRMPQLNLAIWGNLWHEQLAPASPLRRCIRGEAVYGSAMIKALRVTKIVLNFIRRQNLTSHNMRTLEAPAARAFLLTERTHEQAVELFEEGKELACFGTIEELCSKIEYYLSHEAERQQMVELGFRRVQEYQLEKLLKQLLSNLFNKRESA